MKATGHGKKPREEIVADQAILLKPRGVDCSERDRIQMEQVVRIRAALMTQGGFNRRERQKIQYLTPSNEEQRQIVKAALPKKHPARFWMECCGQLDGWGNLNYCKVPLCPRCHMRERTVQTAKAIQKRFSGLQNEDLAFATILLPVQLNFTEMTAVVENEKRRLRTFVDRQRKKDARWDDFELLGWWEIDRTTFGEALSSGRKTRLAFEDLNLPLLEAPSKTIWKPHLHAIVKKGRLSSSEIANALRKETHTGKYQVDIQEFHKGREVANNLKNVIRYSLKFRIENDYKAPDPQDFINSDETTKPSRDWWPSEDILAYVDWLCLKRSGFQSLRVVIGASKAVSRSDDARASSVTHQAIEDVKPSMKTSSCRRTSLDEAFDDEYRSADNKENSASPLKQVSDALSIPRQSTGVPNGCGRMPVYNNILHDTNWTFKIGLDKFATGQENKEKSSTKLRDADDARKEILVSMTVAERVHHILSQRAKAGARGRITATH